MYFSSEKETKKKKQKNIKNKQTNQFFFAFVLFSGTLATVIYKRVSHPVRSNKDEITTFQHLASKIEDVKKKEEVLLLFDVLAGQKHVSSAAAFITDKKYKRGSTIDN